MREIDYHSLAGQVSFHLHVANGRMGFLRAYILLFLHIPHYDTAKNGAGKVQIYLRFISPFFFLGGDGNLQFFRIFGREIFANL